MSVMFAAMIAVTKTSGAIAKAIFCPSRDVTVMVWASTESIVPRTRTGKAVWANTTGTKPPASRADRAAMGYHVFAPTRPGARLSTQPYKMMESRRGFTGLKSVARPVERDR
jgi:hypothetical protein